MEWEPKSSLPHVSGAHTHSAPLSPDHRETGSGLSLLPSPSPASPAPGERREAVFEQVQLNGNAFFPLQMTLPPLLMSRVYLWVIAGRGRVH